MELPEADASMSVGYQSNNASDRTKQIEQDIKSGTETAQKHLVDFFRMK